MSYEEIADDLILACAEFEYRLEQLRDLLAE